MEMIRRDARITAGPYLGNFVVAEEDDKGSIIALICAGRPGSLETIADMWFANVTEFELGIVEGDWDVEWLPDGSLGAST